MPYNPQSGQALAVFLNIKRTKGLAAAKAFGRKHRGDISAAMKGNHNAHGHKKYKSRKKRHGHGAPPPGFQPFQKGAAPPFQKGGS